MITLDSEAYSSFDGLTQSQSFRLACASYDQLDVDGKLEAEPEYFSTMSTASLWTWVYDRTSTRLRTYVFAHHLGYDLRLTQALEFLPAMGFEVRQITLSDYGCWCFMRAGGRSLYLIDSLSHIPKGMADIAGALNRRRPQLPDNDSDNATWEARCAADVRILREALLQYMSMLREHDLGDFRTTGAGQAHAAFRHRFLRSKALLIHSDTEALAAERRACWAGRAEIWQHGEIEGQILEYDFTCAYARCARDANLPVRLKGEVFPGSPTELTALKARYALLMECNVTTDVPLAPTEHKGRIVWPTGSFPTVLWDIELAELEKVGATVDVQRIWAYETEPLLNDWARWILTSIDGYEIGVTPLGRIVAKSWSRSLIGRFGLRYPLLEREGELETSDLVLRPVADLRAGRSYMQLQVGKILYEQTARIESPNSAPAIMGYIMAMCRLKLWDAMQRAGIENVISVDTDGLIVNLEGAHRLDCAIQLGGAEGLRQKATYAGGVFRGPRNMDLGETRRVSGVPKRAARIADSTYRGEVWESLATALRQGDSSTVKVTERTFHVSDRDPRREHFPGGKTGPITLALQPSAC